MKAFMGVLTVFMLVLTAFLLGCPPGTKTVLEVGVKVDADHCKEDLSAPVPDNETVAVDCLSASGEGTIKVQFPRREWYNIVTYHRGLLDAGPGK